jgi:hypothetical protein
MRLDGKLQQLLHMDRMLLILPQTGCVNQARHTNQPRHVAVCAAAGGQSAQPLEPGELAPPARQTLFFSATWPKEVQHIARQLCRNDPVRVFVGNVQVRRGWVCSDCHGLLAGCQFG